MGYFYSVRGWLETNDENFESTRAFISVSKPIAFYNDWVFPSRSGGYSRFAFYGHTACNVLLYEVREQVRAIAETIYSFDGENIDYVEGVFQIDSEDGQHRLIWRLENVVFTEESVEARPRL